MLLYEARDLVIQRHRGMDSPPLSKGVALLELVRERSPGTVASFL